MWTTILHHLAVIGIAAVPIIELKGAIPFAILHFGFDPWYAFALAYIGSCLPAILVLLALDPLIKWLRRFRIFKRPVDWVLTRAHKNKHKIEKYEKALAFGVFVFVAIPLPTTGVWTGSLIAAILHIRFRDALIAVLAGNLVAGTILMTLTNLVSAIA